MNMKNVFSISAKRRDLERSRLGIAGTSLVLIEGEKNLGSCLRVLSRIFPELSGLESDAHGALRAGDFIKDYGDVFTGTIRYGSPIIMEGRDLEVGIVGGIPLKKATHSIFSIFVEPCQNRQVDLEDGIDLPTGWNGQGPYIHIANSVAKNNRELLIYLSKFSEEEQKKKPIRAKISEEFGGDITFHRGATSMLRIPRIDLALTCSR
jgi:hypothetical protein